MKRWDEEHGKSGSGSAAAAVCLSSSFAVQQRSPFLSPLLENVPEELKGYPQWVGWKAVWQDDPTHPAGGQWEQVAYDVRRRQRASLGDPKSRSPFAEVERAYRDGKEDELAPYTGIGFVLTGDDPFVVLELEEAFLGEGVLTQEARTLAERLGSYAERLPSGRGIQIVVQGNLPPGARRRAGLEMYQSARLWRSPAGICPERPPMSREPRQHWRRPTAKHFRRRRGHG